MNKPISWLKAARVDHEQSRGLFCATTESIADAVPTTKLSVETKGVESVQRESAVLNGLRSDREAALVCTYAWSERACVSMGAGKESRELVGRAWRRSLHAYLLAVRRLRQGRRHLGSRQAALLSKESFLGDGHPVSGSWVASRRAAWSIGVRHGCNREGDAVLRRKGAGKGEKASPCVVSESTLWAVKVNVEMRARVRERESCMNSALTQQCGWTINNNILQPSSQ